MSELEGGAMMEKGLRGPLCSMALLGYHTVMTYVLGKILVKVLVTKSHVFEASSTNQLF